MVTSAAFAPSNRFWPSPPTRVEECGLPIPRLADLLLKILYFGSPLSGHELGAAACLAYSAILPAIQSLVDQGWCQTIGRVGPSASGREFGESLGYLISDPGRVRARDVLARDQYVGPAPVPFTQYKASIRSQVEETSLNPQRLAIALQHLTLSPEVLLQIGPAMAARAPVFLYGPPGNGKTSIAEACASLLGDFVFVPHAVEVEGQILRVYDPLHHVPVDRSLSPESDARWVAINRPFIKVGGELTAAALAPSFDPVMRFYEAPLHLKANGGIFLLDDFGRQDISPRLLLNRLIVPLERRIDFLNLVSAGKTVGVPFEAMVVFSTNLDPSSLVDDAFLRRVEYKVAVPDPTAEQFRAIFEHVCQEAGIPFHEAGFAYLLEHHYRPVQRPLRGCQPRDILRHLRQVANFLGRPAVLETGLIDLACHSYFVHA